MTKIKICGLMTKKEALMANEARPDFAGVVFSPGRHQVTKAEALVVRMTLYESIPLVGVFVAEPVEMILELVETGTIQLIQLHGRRPIDEVRRLQMAGVPIIQALVGDDAIDQAKSWQNQLRWCRPQADNGGLEEGLDRNRKLANFSGSLLEQSVSNFDLIDFLMVDAGAGSGQRLDWQRLAGLAPNHLFVAGGIRPDNLSDLLQVYQPAGVDVSSGVETNRHKDLKKMLALVAIAHQEERK